MHRGRLAARERDGFVRFAQRQVVHVAENDHRAAAGHGQRRLAADEGGLVGADADVGERIHDAREAAGLSQRELARRMGTSQAAIDRLESGGVGATLTTLQRVATALGLEVNVELRPSA